MSQEFKTKFEKMRENLTAQQNDNTQSEGITDDKYPASGYARNLIFRWPDGRMKFLNYSYLISCEYLPQDSTITITFTSDTVDLKGELLEDLFLELAMHIPKLIQCKEERYNVLDEGKQTIINEIKITPNNS